MTGSVGDALRLGCAAIGFTIYPGSDDAFDMMEEIRELAEEAKSVGLAVVVWSYPRGGTLSKEGETAIDICAYARAHGGAARRPHHQGEAADRFLEQAEAKKVYEKEKIDISTLRGAHRAMSCRAASTAGASWCSPAAPPRTWTASSTRPARSATAAATARSSAATPSSGRARRRSKMLEQIVGIFQGRG